MNMKALAGLAVFVALASAMTFVGLYSSKVQSEAVHSEIGSTPGVPAGSPVIPSKDATEGSASVKTSVTAGGMPVNTSVQVVE